MKRIFRSKMVTVLAVILIVLLPSCQTTEPVDIADVPAIVMPALPAAAEAAAPAAEETQPEGEAVVSDPALTLDYLGYTVSVTAADGYAEIIYPEAAVTVSDAQAFLIYEAEKYGDEVSGVVYDVSVPGTIMLTYPEGIPEETRYGFASSFLEDIVEYVEMPDSGNVLVFSLSVGETLSKVLSDTVLRSDGYKARVLPEMYYMLRDLSSVPEYNRIVASYADGRLHLAVSQGKTLQLCNVFDAPDFTTAEYFIFLVMKRLQLNPEMSSVCFRTPLDADQEMSLYRYFKDVVQI